MFQINKAFHIILCVATVNVGRGIFLPFLNLKKVNYTDTKYHSMLFQIFFKELVQTGPGLMGSLQIYHQIHYWHLNTELTIQKSGSTKKRHLQKRSNVTLCISQHTDKRSKKFRYIASYINQSPVLCHQSLVMSSISLKRMLVTNKE